MDTVKTREAGTFFQDPRPGRPPAAPPRRSWGSGGGWESHATLPARSVLPSSSRPVFPPIMFSGTISAPSAPSHAQPRLLVSTEIHRQWGLGIFGDGGGGVLGGLCPVPLHVLSVPSLMSPPPPHRGHSLSDHSRTLSSFPSYCVSSCRATSTVITFASSRGNRRRG